MITKKLKGQVFIWNPNAFNGKGYWFVLGKNGSYGKAASKRQAGYLNRPTTKQIEENSPEAETPQKEPSSNTQSSLGKLKDKFNPKNMMKMFNPLGEKATSNLNEEKDQSEFFGKSVKTPAINSSKIGPIDKAFYATVAPNKIVPIRKGESIANVAAKLLAMFNKTYEEKKLQRELNKNFEEEIQLEDKKRHENLIREIYKAKGMKQPSKGKKNKTANKLKDWSDIKNLKIEKGKGGIVGAAKDAASTAAKVGVGVTSTFVAGNVLAKIAGTESGGSYTIMNILPGESKTGTYEAQAGRAKLGGGTYDKSLTDMTLGEVIELGKQRSALSGTKGGGSAAGKYQFMPATIAGLGPKVFGKNWQNVPFNKENQDKMAEALLQEEIASLKRNGVPVSEATVYMTHLTGDGAKVKRIMDPANEDKKMKDVIPALVGSNNDTLANMTVKQYKDSLAKKYSYGPLEETQSQGTVTATKISPGVDIKKGDYGIESHGTMKKVEGLVFHHTGGNSLKVAIATMQQKSHGGNQYAAQFTIDRDGTIYQLTKNETDITYHAGTDSSKGAKVTNWNAIGVEIVSSNSEHFTAEQISAGVSLGKYLQDKYGISNNMIFGHGEIAAMPGGSHNKMPTEGLVVAQTLREGRATQLIASNEMGSKVSSSTSENDKLKNNIKPITLVNNAKTKTEIGKKPDQRVLLSGQKQDYPEFIKTTMAN
jgi:hypothetical protein